MEPPVRGGPRGAPVRERLRAEAGPARRGGVVAIFFGRVANGEELQVFGDGRQTRDYVFAADVVAATLARPPARRGSTTSAPGSRRRFSSSPKAASARAASTPRSSSIHRGSASSPAASSIRRARESALGWRPATSLDEGLARHGNSCRGRRRGRHRGELVGPMDHSVEYEPDQPWRVAAMIATGIAAVELFILLLIGFVVGAKAFSDKTETATVAATSARCRRWRRHRRRRTSRGVRKKKQEPKAARAGRPPSRPERERHPGAASGEARTCARAPSIVTATGNAPSTDFARSMSCSARVQAPPRAAREGHGRQALCLRSTGSRRRRPPGRGRSR